MRILLISALIVMAGCVEDAPIVDPTQDDADGDGYSDAMEAVWQTNATDASSVPIETATSEESMTKSGTLLAPGQGQGCGTGGVEGATIATLTFDVGSTVDQDITRVDDLVFKLDLTDPQNLDSDMDIYDPKGTLIGSTTDSNTMTGPSESFAADASHDPGEYTVVVKSCLVNGGFDVTVSSVVSYRVPVDQDLSQP